MKQTNFIGSENVVNVASSEKMIIFGAYIYDINGGLLLAETVSKHRFNSKINKVVN